jgi:hypothetical protein
MSSFEFFFTLYGLVLGLSVVEVVSGFTRLVYDARSVRVGWLTPLLAIVILTDLCGFWMNAYLIFQDKPLNYLTTVIALAASSLYYVAAAGVFPKDFVAEPDLDAVFLRHRRLTLPCLAVAGLVMFELIPSMEPGGFAKRVAFWRDLEASWQPIVFFLCIPAIMAVRDKRLLIALLILMGGVNIASYDTLMPFWR